MPIPARAPEVALRPTGVFERWQGAYLALQDEALALSDPKPPILGVEVPTVLSLISGALPKLQAYRERLSKLEGFDLPRFDRLQTYLWGLTRAEAIYRAERGAVPSARPLLEQTRACYRRLRSDAKALAERGLISQQVLARLEAPNGYQDTAFKTMALCELLRSAWPQIEGKCAVSWQELREAEDLADRMLRALSGHRKRPEHVRAAAELRDRMLVLLVTAYDEAQAALAWLLRGTDQAEKIAPSLYSLRRKRSRKKAHDEATAEPESAAPSQRQVANAPPAVTPVVENASEPAQNVPRPFAAREEALGRVEARSPEPAPAARHSEQRQRKRKRGTRTGRRGGRKHRR